MTKPDAETAQSPGDPDGTRAGAVSDDVVVARWPQGAGVRDNWGDKLCPVLIELLGGKPVIHEKAIPDKEIPSFMVVGSGIAAAKKRHVVWGMGFLDSEKEPPSQTRICAVRGPLTRAKLLKAGQECPSVYGDPAILLPMFFRPPSEPLHEVGVIRHWRESPHVEMEHPMPDGVRFIDIRGSLSFVIEEILACRRIVSGSLHGLIAAHAYGVPATWVKFSDAPLGDDFKFHDYFGSLGVYDIHPLDEHALTYDDLMGDLCEVEPRISIPDLIDSCPFVDFRRQMLLRRQAEALFPAMPKVRFLKAARAEPSEVPSANHETVPLAPPAHGDKSPIPLLSPAEFSLMELRQRWLERRYVSEQAAA